MGPILYFICQYDFFMESHGDMNQFYGKMAIFDGTFLNIELGKKIELMVS